MFKKSLIRLVGTPFIAAAVLLAVGCASLETATPEKAVEKLIHLNGNASLFLPNITKFDAKHGI